MAPVMKHAKTRKGKKFLENRQPKFVENDKQALIAKGGKCSEVVSQALAELYALKKPLAQQLKQKNPFHLFEDETGLLKLAQKMDTSLFVFGTHSKKHPGCLIFGRLFDHQLLDMVEMSIKKFVSSSTFNSGGVTFGCKPAILLQGKLFEENETMKRWGNLMVDWFRGPAVESVRLQGLEMVISLTATSEEEVLFRVYKTRLLKSSDSTTPRVELIEMGPNIDFAVGRNKFATHDYFKSALEKPREVKAKPKNKNVSHDVFGTKVARIHVGRQQLDDIPTRRVRALKKKIEGAKSTRIMEEE